MCAVVQGWSFPSPSPVMCPHGRDTSSTTAQCSDGFHQELLQLQPEQQWTAAATCSRLQQHATGANGMHHDSSVWFPWGCTTLFYSPPIHIVLSHCLLLQCPCSRQILDKAFWATGHHNSRSSVQCSSPELTHQGWRRHRPAGSISAGRVQLCLAQGSLVLFFTAIINQDSAEISKGL